MKLHGFLKCEDDEIIPGHPWKLHRGAFDGTNAGFLHVNIQQLTGHIDSCNKTDQVELDFVAFVPTWDKSIATPKRFARTPGKSIFMKSISRPLARITSHGSGINVEFT